MMRHCLCRRASSILVVPAISSVDVAEWLWHRIVAPVFASSNLVVHPKFWARLAELADAQGREPCG
jgi:hypothetical protein